MATQNKSLTKLENGSTGPWKKIGAVLLGVGLIAAYRYARNRRGEKGLKSTFSDLKNEVTHMGEAAQDRVMDVVGKLSRKAKEGSEGVSLNSVRSGRKSSLAAHPH